MFNGSIMNSVTSTAPDFSVKNSLAKLLAKENIQVQTGNYRTASFDPVARILYLPLFKKDAMTKDMMDMFIGHEVSHALYTPNDSIETIHKNYGHIPFALFNVVEDIRIERIIQKTYPGLMLNFNRGYKELVARDWFQIKGKDLSSLGLADRLNLHAKIGDIVSIPLNANEMEFFKKCYAAETFEDVLKLTVELYDSIKNGSNTNEGPEPQMSPQGGDNQEENQEEATAAGESSEDESNGEKMKTEASGSSDESEESDVPAEINGKPSKTEETSEQTKTSSVSNGSPSKESINNDLLVSTNDAVKKALEEQTEESRYSILTPPTRQELNAALITYKELEQMRTFNKQSDTYKYFVESNTSTVDDLKKQFNEFVLASRQYVSILVNEFNRKKSASLYSRTTSSKVGILDTTRLHTYKYSEDIFKSVSITPEDKNHGMMMFVDMSGSMEGRIHDTARQVIQLAMFCRQVGIPFEVYGFNTTQFYGDVGLPLKNEERKINIMRTSKYHMYLDSLNIVNLLSSEQSKVQFNESIEVMFSYGKVSTHCLCQAERLSGTPLCEMVIAAHTLVSDFKKKHKVEKMNVIVLSDGDGCRPTFTLGHSHEAYYGPKSIIMNGRQVNINKDNFETWYSSLISNLGITCECNVIGYFLVCNSTKAIMNQFRSMSKEKAKSILEAGSANIGNHMGYSSYFVITNNSIQDYDEEMSDIKIDGSVTSRSNMKKIASVFTKHMESQKNSRIFLRDFSAVIA